MSKQGFDRNHDDLDRQICEALGVEPSHEQIERLERFWRRQSLVGRRRPRAGRRAAWAVAVAAILVVGAIVSLRPRRPELGKDTGPSDGARPPVAATHPHRAELPEDVAVVRAMAEGQWPSAGRPPTVYERLVFAARSHQPAAVRWPSTVAEEPRSSDKDVERAIAQLLEDPDADVRQLVFESGLVASDVEELLLRELPRSDHARRRAVVRLLAVRGTRHSIPPLLDLARHASLRDDALESAERIVGAEGLARLLPTTDDRQVRTALLRRLMAADSDAALGDYLLLVRDPATRTEALAVADTVSGRLLERLLRLLEDKEKSVRLSAAMVLARTDGPEVAAALVELVTSRPAVADDARRTEAWIALMSCRGREVDAFLAQAMVQPTLLRQFNRARVQLERMIPVSL